MGLHETGRGARRRASVCVAALALAMAFSSSASAQKKNEAQEAARGEGEIALKLFDQGKFAEAIEHFDKADKLYHAPTLLLFEARCQMKLGKLLAARALLQRVTGEALPKNAPKQFIEAQKAANAELSTVKAKIAFVRFRVTGGTAGAITVDGEPVTGAASDSHEADPGKHKVVIEGGPGVRAEREFTLADGGNDEVAIELPPPPAQPSTTAPTPVEHDNSGTTTPIVLAFGVGGVGILVGSVTGIMSLSKASEAKQGCNAAGHCPSVNKTAADSAGSLGIVSTIGFVLGVAGVATGATLYVMRHKSGSTRVGLGPSSIQIDGSF